MSVIGKAQERIKRMGLTEKRAKYYEDGYFDGYIDGEMAATDRLLSIMQEFYGKKPSIPDAEVRPIGKAETR